MQVMLRVKKAGKKRLAQRYRKKLRKIESIFKNAQYKHHTMCTAIFVEPPKIYFQTTKQELALGAICKPAKMGEHQLNLYSFHCLDCGNFDRHIIRPYANSRTKP